ncbi:MAG: DHH family phosphoesterase, partial [Thermomicrobiaceae bacterium]|nr:DHH family phosphoesterase [Thermomicrobiaceae bacterium]
MTRSRDGFLTGDQLRQADLEVAWQALSSARSIVVLTHANPDADAIASLLAVADSLAGPDRRVQAASGDGALPEALEFLPGASRIADPRDLDIAGVDLLALVDCADAQRLGPLYRTHPEWFDGRVPILNVDHHVTNERYGQINVVDPTAAATAEILAIMLLELGIPVPPDVATCLLAGIYGDTLSLRTPSTTGRTLRVTAALRELGADLDTVVDNLFRIKPFSTVKLWALALERAEILGPIVWTEITPVMLDASGAVPAEGEGIVNFLAGTKGASAAVLFYRQADG